MLARGLGPLEETATERPMCCEAAGNRPRLDCGSQARLADADPFEDHPFVLVGSAAVPHPARQHAVPHPAGQHSWDGGLRH